MSSISYRLEKLSLSDDPALESSTPTVNTPVQPATPVATDSTMSKIPVRPRLVHIKPKMFERLSNSVKAGLYRSMKKRRDLKKPQAPIPPLPTSQCSLVEQQYSPIGQRLQAMGGLWVSDLTEANPHRRDARFQEPSAFAAQGNPNQQGTNTTFPQPWSSDTSPSTSTSTLWTLGDEVTDDAMEEDERSSPSPPSPSPTPMDLEAYPPSSDATLGPESPQAPFEAPALRDSRDLVAEPTDEHMSDEEQGYSSSEGPHQPEPTDIMIDTSSTEIVSSTVFNQEIDMVDAEDQTPSISFGPSNTSDAQPARDAPASNERIQLATSDPNPGPAPAPVSFANAATSEGQSLSAQPLPIFGFHQAPEVISAASKPSATNPPAPNIQSTDPALVPTANATLSPAAVGQVVAPPASATKSRVGPSTATPASPTTNSSEMQGQAGPNEHASRVHQVLSKLRLSKQAPKSTPPSLTEEAEVKAFFDDLFRRVPRRDLSKPQAKPAPPPPTSEPKQTKGSASRSLMDDLMAGFRKSSQEQITAAARPSTQSRPTATNVPSTSSTTQLAHQRPLPLVTGRKPDPRPTLPSSVVENGRYVVASPSGRAPATVSAPGKVPSSSPTTFSTQQAPLPVVAGRQTGPTSSVPSSIVRTGRQVAAQLSGRAPWTVSVTDKVNGPSGSTSAGAGITSDARQSSSAGMDGVDSGQRPTKGSGRVARAIRRTGLTWQLVQQNVQRNQAALDTAQANAATSTAISALERDVEERRSQEWHAAQPPPPPEAIPYITTGEKYEGDENDHVAMINWLLTQED
ncbi:hypothetical protein FRC00_001471 [Tulasnella sp. 408]|nr:hypothetical protein FRC00_001471 [Tulasnella sp. 408]